MSARDILTNGLLHLPVRGRKLEFAVDQQIAALTAAGYRILPPGALDAESLERAAKLVEQNTISYSSDGKNVLRRRLDGDRQSIEYAAAIRSLSPCLEEKP